MERGQPYFDRELREYVYSPHCHNCGAKMEEKLMKYFPIEDLYDYACDKFYRVLYRNNIYGDERTVNGILLYCHGPSIVLLCENGMYYIKHKDILLMEPIPMTFKMSEEYRSVVETYLAKCADQK